MIPLLSDMITRLNGVRERKSWLLPHSCTAYPYQRKPFAYLRSLRYWKCLRINIMTTLFICYFDSRAKRVPLTNLLLLLFFFTDSFRANDFHTSRPNCVHSQFVITSKYIDTLFMAVSVLLCVFFCRATFVHRKSTQNRIKKTLTYLMLYHFMFEAIAFYDL